MRRPDDLVIVFGLALALIAIWQLLPLWAGWLHLSIAP